MPKAVTAKLMLLFTCVGVLAACATTDANRLPAISPEGLVLMPDSKVSALYLRPGASFGEYEEFGVTDCEVAFRKNWLRDQNSGTLDISNRMTQRDVDKIRDTLSEHCEAAFRAALEKEPAYKVVEEFAEGERVLVLRPSIVNLDINAPDNMSAGRTRSYTTSAGEMTMILELLDATTGELLARATDKRRAPDTGRMQWTNSVTNKVEADRILNSWARQLRAALDRATSH